MSPENFAHFEYHKMQLMGSLTSLANNLRECAGFADQFAGIVNNLTYGGNGVAFSLGNGQYPMPVAPPMIQDDGSKKRKARGDDPDGKRKAKKLKDPNAPKRPPSSYLLFQNDIRQQLKAKNPGLSNNELLGAISKLWAEMPKEEKDQYEQRNKLAKEEWLAQKAVYETGHGAAPGIPHIASPVVAPAKVAPPIIPPPAATTSPSSDDEDSSPEEDQSSSDSSSEEESKPDPPTKKSKKESAAATTKEAKKEKKHKKTRD